MNTNNTVVIVSSAEIAIQEVKNMLVLLREVDKVQCSDFYDAEDLIVKSRPNVIIIHSSENDKNCLKFLKKIKKNPKIKNIPVILYEEYSTTDYIIEAFDSGISDLLSAPLKDYELVIRVIWAIQKSELITLGEVQDGFLGNLGIKEKETGFFKSDYSTKYLESVIDKSKANKQNSCLLLLKISKDIDIKTRKDIIAKALKMSVRINDVIAAKNDYMYYIFLSKSKLSGVYAVYERILSHLSALTHVSAAVVEIKDELFSDIINVLEYAIDKIKNNELYKIQKSDYIEMYKIQEDIKSAKEPDCNKTTLEIAEFFKEAEIEKKIQATLSEINYGENSDIETKNKKNDMQDTCDSILQEKLQESILDVQEQKKLSLKEKKAREERDADERNTILYKQSWKKKLTIIIQPLLKKYAAKLQNDFKALDADLAAHTNIAYMKLNKNDIKLNFEIIYDGLKNVCFNLAIIALGTEIESDTFEIEITDFDFQKLDIILKTITDEYRNYLTED